MDGVLRGVERLGGSKSFEEHVRKLEAPKLQGDKVGVSAPHGLKDELGNVKVSTSGIGMSTQFHAHIFCSF